MRNLHIFSARRIRMFLMHSIVFATAVEGDADTSNEVNTIHVTCNHSLSAVINAGASASFNDSGTCSLHLFDPAQGTLTKATVNVKTNGPTFNGDITYGLLGSLLNLTTTDSEVVSFTLSNDNAVSGSGTVGGVTSASISLPPVLSGTGSVVVSGSASTMDITTVITDPSQLNNFIGTGDFDVNANVSSQLATDPAILATTLTGIGDYPIEVSVSYEFTAAISTPTPTPSPSPSASPTPSPSPSASPTTSPGPSASPTVSPSPSPSPAKERLLNISTRFRIGNGDAIGIAGFIISGTATKKVIVRGIGPSLTGAGIPANTTLKDPAIEVHNEGGTIIATNNNWRQNQQAKIQASGLPPENDMEAAVVLSLQPGAYTAVMRGNNQTTGIGLVEVYDLEPESSSTLELLNVSSRGYVDTGDNVMIGGFILKGGTGAKILVRAIGPELSDFDVSPVLEDPTLEVYDGMGRLLGRDDDWKDTQETEIAATGIPPTDDHESAELLTLGDGAYTVVVRGAGATVGIGLVEVYNIRD